jgi:glycosyltransferase involved in cell wall biosynthesis
VNVPGRPVRVLALVPYPLGRVPGQRYRFEQWAPHLRAARLDVEFAPFLSAGAMAVLYRPGHAVLKARATLAGHLRRVRELARARRFDVAYVYREAALLGPPWFERRLARLLPFVFDFDDAIWLPASSPANARAARLKPPGKTAELCRLAWHVIVGNETLAAWAREHARQVSVVPSTIDTDAYVVRPRPRNPRPVVGWTGSITTLPYLLTLVPALRRLRSRVDFELRIIGAEPQAAELSGLDARSLPWDAVREVDDLRPFDVGLMPLPDDAWSRGKCAMKALQYMALAIPPVVAPVGLNATLVEHEVNGLHARSDDEWVDGLARLLADPGLRTRLGAAARATVERGYGAAQHAPRVAEILRAACERR